VGRGAACLAAMAAWLASLPGRQKGVVLPFCRACLRRPPRQPPHMEPPQQQIVGTFSAIALLRTVLRTPSLFGAFCLGCLLTPLLVTVVPQQSNTSVASLGALPELAPRPFDAQAWLGHFADPAVALGGALMLLVEGLRAAAGILSPGDERAANWFLLNGGVIHTMMDGLTGGYHFLPLMDENYRRLDNRANGVLVDGLAKTGGTPGLTDDAVAVAMVRASHERGPVDGAGCLES
jgi:hypothetical protein